jgi:hypothetical protein
MTFRTRQQQGDEFLAIRNPWMEGKAPMPGDPVSIFETNFNNLLNLYLDKGTSICLGIEGSAARPVTIVNKLSGRALGVENASIGEAALIIQSTRNDAPNQRWFIERGKLGKKMVIPAVIFREVHRYWPSFLRFPLPVYSLVAAHSGLCLDILNASTENSDLLHQSPAIGRSSQLWAIAPDHKGAKLIVNLCSGQVLDLVDCSPKNYAMVRQHPFNGGDSQRWQLFS